MTVLADTRNMDRDEWLAARTKGIGGSDAAAIAGLSPWRTPIQVWMEKTGQIVSPDLTDNEAVYWGTVLEDLVAKEFAKRTGFWVQRRNAILVHPEHEFMIGNIDRLVRPERGVGEWGVLEVKTTSEYAKDQWSEDEVPAHYLIQLQHYLAVTGYIYGYFAVLIGGNKYRHFRVERDDELIAHLIEIETKFWNENVLKHIPPAWDGSSASTDLLNSLYPISRPTEIELPQEAEDLIAQYDEADRYEKEWAKRKDEARNKLCGLLGENERGTVRGRLVTWKTVTTNRLDTKALQKDHPGIYDEYIKPSAYRRFGIR
jgi:putative phage-type endonuclease